MTEMRASKRGDNRRRDRATEKRERGGVERGRGRQRKESEGDREFAEEGR